MKKQDQLSKDELKAIGKKIKILRVENGITQEEFAKAIGVFRYRVSHWETGIAVIPTSTLFEICKIFKVKLEYFDIYKQSCAL